MQYGGHWYGLSRETIERVAREGFACCVHMELEVQYGIKKTRSIMLNKHKTGSNATAVNYAGRFCVFVPIQGVYSLKNSYFEPRYVLLIPTVVDNYVCFLKARGFYSNAQTETAVSRIDLYAKINRESSGFFDNIIPCGNKLLLTH